MDTPGKRLKNFRKLKGLSGEALGDLVGTNKSKISKLESGEQTLDTKWAKKLAPHLGVKPVQLLPDMESEDDLIRQIQNLAEEERRLVDGLVQTILNNRRGK